MTGDERRPSFVWITVAALRAMREGVGKGEGDPGLAQVRSVYGALVELANESRVRGAPGDESGSFSAERQKIAAYAGLSKRTVSAAATVLERLDLLRIERPENQGRNQLPSRYVLVEREDPLQEVQGVQARPIAGGARDPLQEVQGTTKEETTKKKKAVGGDGDESKKDTSPLPAAVDSSEQGVEDVWGHYVATFDRRGRAAELQPDDRKIIREALRVGDAGELKAAISACERSDWHMKRGQFANRSGGRLFSLALIFEPRRGRPETWRSRLDWWLERGASDAEDKPTFDVNAEMERIRREQGLDP